MLQKKQNIRVLAEETVKSDNKRQILENFSYYCITKNCSAKNCQYLKIFYRYRICSAIYLDRDIAVA
jgi:hypothetical protein